MFLFVWCLSGPPAASAALPGPLGALTGSGSGSSQPADDAQLNRSLDQVIQMLENDKERTDLLSR
ncbi:hypothetical protein, partial [Achromobacter xylosoxidans]